LVYESDAVWAKARTHMELSKGFASNILGDIQ